MEPFKITTVAGVQGAIRRHSSPGVLQSIVLIFSIWEFLKLKNPWSEERCRLLINHEEVERIQMGGYYSSSIVDLTYITVPKAPSTFVLKVGLRWVPGGSSHTEPEEARLEPGWVS